MDQAKIWFGQLNDVQKKIAMAAAVIIVLMILFPPKAIAVANPLLGGMQSQHYGYMFILSDPTAQARAMGGDLFGQYIQSYIEWGRLLIQLVVVGAVAFFAIKSQGPKSTPVEA